MRKPKIRCVECGGWRGGHLHNCSKATLNKLTTDKVKDHLGSKPYSRGFEKAKEFTKIQELTEEDVRLGRASINTLRASKGLPPYEEPTMDVTIKVPDISKDDLDSILEVLTKSKKSWTIENNRLELVKPPKVRYPGAYIQDLDELKETISDVLKKEGYNVGNPTVVVKDAPDTHIPDRETLQEKINEVLNQRKTATSNGLIKNWIRNTGWYAVSDYELSTLDVDLINYSVRGRKAFINSVTNNQIHCGFCDDILAQHDDDGCNALGCDCNRKAL